MTLRDVKVPHGRSICDDPSCSHNRWHPAIAPVVRVAPGETIVIETRDSLDGQIRPGMTAAALADISLDVAHVLTGPIHVEGAEPGDMLAIHIDDVIAADYGFTAVLPPLGLLSDVFDKPFLLHWDLDRTHATSPDLPGIRIAAAPFMGVMGLAPSLERLRAVNRRERRLIEEGGLALPPTATGAVPSDPAIAAEAWRTVAAHEVGGNMDVRQLVAGTTLYLPVDVPGALFSTGDAHFAQGDGESCGTAIETSATLVARFELLKGAGAGRGPEWSTPGPLGGEDGGKGFIATTGLSVLPETGRILPRDASLAARNAALAMIEKLGREHGLSPEQAYCLISVAGDLRISSIVNVPHAFVSLTIPRAIFG